MVIAKNWIAGMGVLKHANVLYLRAEDYLLEENLLLWKDIYALVVKTWARLFVLILWLGSLAY
ncbi:hypothetical protein FACS1894181_09140 [Bacteroidia bacterium]|nr:hypothetical protein FACS1894181_09140 [Bacteroidia bacterium]